VAARTTTSRSSKLARALGPLLAVLLIAASAARGDVGVVSVDPKAAGPGEGVNLTVGCGACSAEASFPVSLIPVKSAPRPHPCGENALCNPTAAGPPRDGPFVFLGSTSGGRPLYSGADRVGSKSDLRFGVPELVPGGYAFVIFCASCVRGPRGSLLDDTRPGQLLRILPSEASSDSSAGGDTNWWFVGGIAAIGLAIGGVLLLRRRRAA
jgi:hypothetical protein